MSMKVRSNLAATDALHNLNKNNSDLAKAIKKVSTGMDFNSSGDNSSGYSISERMRVQIRALNQNIRNVQTGNSLISVAEGGIQSIIDNLRSMKEMCLNAMNDHNTDQDRATIQKEYDKRMELIQDIASETSYNGKLLLDGRYESPAAQKYTDPVQLPMDKDSNGALTVPIYNGMKTTTMSIEEAWVYRPSNRANWPSASSTGSTTPTAPSSTAGGDCAEYLCQQSRRKLFCHGHHKSIIHTPHQTGRYLPYTVYQLGHHPGEVGFFRRNDFQRLAELSKRFPPAGIQCPLRRMQPVHQLSLRFHDLRIDL